MAEQANFKRINFFEGFFTTDEDWNAAEAYHLEKRRLHNRVLHTPGVVPVAGGGMKVGQVIGSTDRLGAYAASTPIHYQDVLATVYHNLGIDINRATLNDWSGRPRYLVDHTRYQPLKELS